MKIISVNTSTQKGTIKTPVDTINLTAQGIEGDVNAGNGHQQVSLLALENLELFSTKLGRTANHGEFGENITTQGVELHKLNPFDRLIIGNVILEVTQIGEKCPDEGSEDLNKIDNALTPWERIFARVIKGGVLKSDDQFTVTQKQYKCLIVTMSDRASRGECEDKSGPLLEQILHEYFDKNNRPITFERCILPNDEDAMMDKMVTSHRYDLIFTTGGMGIGKRDMTPDVVSGFLDKEIPGIMELIRVKYGAENPLNLLSRGVSGIKGNTLIFTLPDNPKAIREYLDEINKIIFHAFLMMAGIDGH